MQQSERFGDTQAAQRPMLQRVLRDGIEQFGLEVDAPAPAAGDRALRAVDRQDSEVIGALEVGYNVLPELPDLSAQLAAGLALIINREALQASQTTPPSGVQLSEGSDWLLIGHSATQVLHWAQAGVLPEPGSGGVRDCSMPTGAATYSTRFPAR